MKVEDVTAPSRFPSASTKSNVLDERWEDWARERYIELSDKLCKFRFEVLESLRNMPADQRRRLFPVATEFLFHLNDADEASFRTMFDAWQGGNSSEFRRATLESFRCDPEAWRRWRKK